MKKVKIISVILMIILASTCFILQPTLTYARDSGTTPGDQKNEYKQQYQNNKGSSSTTNGGSGTFNPDDYEPDSTTQVTNGDELAKAGSKIMGTVMSIASVIAVLTFSIIGIKYMLGSVEEKAQYKKTLFPYLVGAIMVFGITTVIQIISAVAGNIPS